MLEPEVNLTRAMLDALYRRAQASEPTPQLVRAAELVDELQRVLETPEEEFPAPAEA